MNDDVLGRVLDAIYKYGPSKLYPQLAMQAVKTLGLLCRFGHMDSTSFHVDGQYNSDEESEEGVIHITKGYSRDNHPDLNQVVLQLVSERQAGIPLLMQALSGNNSDKERFCEMVEEFAEQMRGGFGIEYLIVDSALYSAKNLKAMSAIKWITRVPETLGLACDVIDVLAPELMRDPSQSAFRNLEVEYGEVHQRWVVVFSPEAYQRAHKTVNKQCGKQSTAKLKAFAKLCRLCLRSRCPQSTGGFRENAETELPQRDLNQRHSPLQRQRSPGGRPSTGLFRLLYRRRNGIKSSRTNLLLARQKLLHPRYQLTQP